MRARVRACCGHRSAARAITLANPARIVRTWLEYSGRSSWKVHVWTAGRRWASPPIDSTIRLPRLVKPPATSGRITHYLRDYMGSSGSEHPTAASILRRRVSYHTEDGASRSARRASPRALRPAAPRALPKTRWRRPIPPCQR